MKRCILTKRAEQDIRSIRDYTVETWGYQQTDQYLLGLDTVLKQLAEAPDTYGRPRDDLKPGYHSSLYESHVIFFKIRKEGISVIRVLHQRQDIPKQLR